MASKPDHIFRIAHFSDTHTGLKDFKASYLLDKRFFGRINQFFTRQRHLSLENISRLAELIQERQVDFTVCTGDLTSIGSPAEFLLASQLLQPIRQAAGENFLYVPGNHDAYIDANKLALEETFSALNNGRFNLKDLPATLDVGPVQFVLTCGARPCHIWQSTGEFSPTAWQKLDYILTQPTAGLKSRLLLSHFPLCNHHGAPLTWRTKLLDYQRLVDHANAGHFHAMLTGHVHHPFIESIGDQGTIAIGAGSLTIHNACAFIDIDLNTGKITPEIHRF